MNEYETLAQSDSIYLDTSALAKIEKFEGNSSQLVNLLVYGSTLPKFSSYVAFGEFIGILGRRDVQQSIGGTIGYLFRCRRLMAEVFDIQKIRRAEPVQDRFQFVRLAEQLWTKYSKLGGGDIWHLMAVLELQQTNSAVALLTFDEDLAKAARSEKIQTVYGVNLKPEFLIEALRSKSKWIAI